MNLRIGLATGVRATTEQVSLAITGAEQYQHPVPLSEFKGDEARLHYVPGVTAGNLTFTGAAVSAAGTVVAGGSVSVTLVAGKAVSALLLLDAAHLPDASAPPDGPADHGNDAVGDGGVVEVDAAGERPTLHQQGDICTATEECVAGLSCADGVCCSSACSGGCVACNLTGWVGTCKPIPAGADPDNECADNGAQSCGTDGFCDGKGACELYSSNTVCAAAQCDAGSFTPGRLCTGNGACGAATATPCGAQVCTTNGCKTACTTSTDCASGYACANGVCKLDLGHACAGGGDCATGYCVDGVCCNTSCVGTCMKCNLTGISGSCTSISAGLDPDGECPAAACPTATSFVPRSYCSGSNSCQIVSTSTCNAGYACALPGGCHTTCTVSADCAAGYGCFAGVCKKSNSQSCGTATDCGSGNCVDGFCCSVSACGQCNKCTGANGTCVAANEGVTCNDGSLCTVNDVCKSGICKGAAKCDDYNPCSSDACDATGTCTHGNALNGTACNTNTCMVNMTCTSGVCGGGSFKPGAPETCYPSVPGKPNCGDGIDNDGNGLTDCADPACAAGGTTLWDGPPYACCMCACGEDVASCCC